MSSAGCRHGAVEYGRRGTAPDAIAMVRTVEVVELDEPVKAAIERRPAGDSLSTKPLVQAWRGLMRVWRIASAV